MGRNSPGTFSFSNETCAFIWGFYTEMIALNGPYFWDEVLEVCLSQNPKQRKKFEELVGGGEIAVALEMTCLKLNFMELWAWIQESKVVEVDWMSRAIINSILNIIGESNREVIETFENWYLAYALKSIEEDNRFSKIKEKYIKEMDEKELASNEALGEFVKSISYDWKHIRDDIVEWTNYIGDKYVDLLKEKGEL